MDCKIWLKDREEPIEINNIENVKPVLTHGDIGINSIVVYNDPNETKPIATFYNIEGYLLLNRAKNVG